MRTALGLLWPAVFALCSASVWIQPPSLLRMEAINTRYTLHWDWPSAHHHACFTVQYMYSHERVWSRSVCEGVCVQSCDLSAQLAFSGSYLLRVRAESAGQRSNWSHALKFTPDEDTLLGQPRGVSLRGGVAVVTVQMAEPVGHDGTPMSHLMKDLTYRLTYWDTHIPAQVHEKDTNLSLLTLHLKPDTEYCMRVCVFSRDYHKTSNYTHTQCIHTHGQRPVLQVTLGVCAGVCVVALLTGIHYLRRKQDSSPHHHIPTILQAYTTSGGSRTLHLTTTYPPSYR
ncbi:hypothetical protein ACEWY4_028094 [Coilia grayii]|uniref:Fibronectin type-III domain-containing protein n=1 Tax=Coilia grayii TaxID=363190 RepID=A0ABD1IMU1_9TELE